MKACIIIITFFLFVLSEASSGKFLHKLSFYFCKTNIAISRIGYIESMWCGCIVLHHWICLTKLKLLFRHVYNRTRQQDRHQKQWRYWPYSRVSVIGSCLVTNTVGSNSSFDFFLHRNCGKANRAQYGNRSIARYNKSFGSNVILIKSNGISE